jgi:hypothetical protein
LPSLTSLAAAKGSFEGGAQHSGTEMAALAQRKQTPAPPTKAGITPPTRSDTPIVNSDAAFAYRTASVLPNVDAVRSSVAQLPSR